MNNTLSKQDYINALIKLEKSPNDRIGVLGEIGVVTTGAVAGGLAAGTLASAFGLTTLLGSSTLASIGAGVFVVSNPAGWVFGTAAAGAAVAYGISKIVKGGGISDERKHQSIKNIKEKIAAYELTAAKTGSNERIGQLSGAFALLLESDFISQEEVTSILQGVDNRSIDIDSAFLIVNSLLEEMELISTEAKPLESDKLTVRSAFVILLKYMIYADGIKMQKETDVYRHIMKNNFKCSQEYSDKLLHDAPLIEDINETLKEIKPIIPSDSVELLIESLIGLGYSDGEYHAKEKDFVAHVKSVFQYSE
ncbi:MAG: TerB family tellurite resistance protein [Gammaproteobacteria bacterium]|nr:TerB family tellurite resistance protein [Gammaproteobacteria bacterium]